MEAEAAFSILPLSSALSNSALSNSLPFSLILPPFLSRLAQLESLLLLSPFGRALSKLGLGQKRILFLSFSSITIGLIKIRTQWRSLFILAGLCEGILRGIGILNEIEIGSLEHDSELKRKKIVEEIKHLLSFWTLVGIIEIVQRIVIQPIPTQAVGVGYKSGVVAIWRKRMDKAFFEITKNLPLPASLRPAARPSRAFRPFPAPLPLIPVKRIIPPLDRITFLPARYFSEIQFANFKVLLLWNGLRKDGFGASLIWNWLLNPFFIVMRKRRMNRIMKGEEIKRKKVIKVIVVDDDDSEEEEEGYMNVRTTNNGESNNDPRQEIRGYDLHEDSTTLSNSPETKFTLPAILQAQEIDQDNSFNQSFNSELPSPTPPNLRTKTSSLQAMQQRFPTPNGVSYRLTSSSFPIHARVPSRAGSGSDLTTESLSKLEQGIASPIKKYLEGLGGAKARSEGLLGEESRPWADI